MIPPDVRQLLREVAGPNPFYTKKFAGLDIDALERMEDIPYTTKEEWVADQLENPPYGTNLTFALERYTRYCQTSGTTGKPMRWLDTNDSWQWMLNSWQAVYQAAGIRAGDKLFFAFSFGPFLGFWTAYDCASRMGCMAIPGGGMSTVARVQMILDNEVDAVLCTPTYALHMGQIASHENLDLAGASVRSLIVAGEPGGSIPATRQAIETAWGATCLDHHGMTEVGPVTVPHPEGLMVIGKSYHAESVDVDSDGVGELVLTTLGRTGSPLIRYRTGDRVRMREDGVLLGGILGRADDMRIVRGVNIYPTAIEAIVRQIDGVVEFRVRETVVGAMSEIEVEIEPEYSAEGDLLQSELESQLRQAFSMRIPVKVLEPGDLPRFELKARRWVTESTHQGG